MTERRFDLVIFDCDGVLVDTERLVVEIEARILTELGWEVGVAEVVSMFMGKTDPHNLALIEHRLGRELMLEFDRLSTLEVRQAFETRLQPIEAVDAVIDRLHADGIPTCVASSGNHSRIRTTLGITGLLPLFEGRIFSAEDVARGKPAPDVFLHAAAGMAVAPNRCAVVEDSVSGVIAAVAAGMTVFGYAGGMAPPDLLAAEGAVLFQHMNALYDLLVPADRPQ